MAALWFTTFATDLEWTIKWKHWCKTNVTKNTNNNDNNVQYFHAIYKKIVP